MARWATDDPKSGAVDQVEAAQRAGIPIATHGVSVVDGVTYKWGPEDVAANIGRDPRDLKNKKGKGDY